MLHHNVSQDWILTLERAFPTFSIISGHSMEGETRDVQLIADCNQATRYIVHTRPLTGYNIVFHQNIILIL